MERQLDTPVPLPFAWKGAQLANDPSWIYCLSADAIRDIETALARMAAHPVDLQHQLVEKSDFPLPSISSDLEALLEDVEGGRGFVVIRGLPVERYTVDEAATIFRGLCAHFGSAASQNADGELLTHVMDRGLEYGSTNVRGYMTRGGQKFHSDNADIVALLCIRKAKSGGLSSVSSAMTVYNEFLEKHPDYLDVLYRGFRYDLHGEERPGLPPVTERCIPVFSYCQDLLSCRYVYSSIVRAPRKTGVPLTEKELTALELFNQTVERQDIRLDMDLRPGDMQFLNNHTVLHSRTEYVDYEEPERRRHMMRMWISPSVPRPLALDFADRYGTGERLGVPPVPKRALS